MIKLMYTFNRVDSSHEDFKKLVLLLDEELAKRDGEEHAFYDQFNKIENINNVIVAYAGQQPVAAGAFKKFSPEAVEIKRMFVRKDKRGKGLSKRILEELETWAKEQNYKYSVLETSKYFNTAQNLYSSHGYGLIPNYGPYANLPGSVCMKKELK